MSSVEQASVDYRDRFEAVRAGLPGAGLAWLDRLREQALTDFAEAGLPTVRAEAWKYTNLNALKPLLLRHTAPAAPVSVDRVNGLLAAGEAWRVVFVDGTVRDDLSDLADLPAGLTVRRLADALAEDGEALEPLLREADGAGELPMVRLNTAFMADGCVVDVADDATMERPLELVFATTGSGATHAVRNVVRLGTNSRLDMVETFIGLAPGADIISSVTQAQCRDGAVLRRTKLQDEAVGAHHLANLIVGIGEDARFANFELTKGARLSRSESVIRLAAPGAELGLGGAYLMRGKQHCDHTTWIDHAAADTQSRETYKGVLDDQARAVFQGKITVRPDAQRINGHQLNKTLLLSDKAEIDTKPELEILADDVKCSHGATAGALDDDALFYLRSRGIPSDVARGILIEAFLGEAIDEVEDETIRAALAAQTRSWFAAAGTGDAV